jgi:putative hydrolase of the HAD superfamily
VPTLDELRGRGIRLALVSNFIDTLQTVCAVNGIAGYFDTIVCSVEAGAMKPDPRIFQVALRRIEVPAARAWHVGDNYWADVLGARAAGLEPVLIDRARTGVRADCPVITTLDEVVDLIEERAAA